MALLDRDKVIKLEICTLRGHILLTVAKGFSFPRKILKEEHKEGDYDIAMIRAKNLPIFARGAPITVVAYTRAGDRLAFPGQIAMSTDFQLNVTLQPDKGRLLPDRRRYYKLNAQIPCFITSITRNDKYVAVDPPLSGMIQDINIGGIFLESSPEVEFACEDTISVLFTDVMGETELICKVLRVKTSSEGYPEGYGCCFLYLNARQEEVIAGFINRLQVKQRQLEKAESERIED